MKLWIVSRRAFTLVEVLIVLGIVVLLVAITSPLLIKSRQVAQSNARVANIRQIDAALEQYLLETTPPPSELDARLAQAPWGKIAYQIPKSIQIHSNGVVILKLSPSKTFEELTTYFNTNLPATLRVAKVQFGEKMKASLVSDPDTLKIIPKQDETQPVSYVNDTTWSWHISPRRPGKYWLHLKLEILVTMDGDKLPYPIVSHDDYMMVEATNTQKVLSFVRQYWQWILTTLGLPILYFIGRRIRSGWAKRKAEQHDAQRIIGFKRPPGEK